MTDIAGRLRRAEPAGDEQVAYARALCRRHAAPLFVMASLLLDEGDTAGDIVAAVLAVASRGYPDSAVDDDRMRLRLARSVYHRCLGRLAVRERSPQLGTARRVRRPTHDQRALLALIVFGGHDITQAAITLRRPRAAVLAQLMTVLFGLDLRDGPQSPPRDLP